MSSPASILRPFFGRLASQQSRPCAYSPVMIAPSPTRSASLTPAASIFFRIDHDAGSDSKKIMSAPANSDRPTSPPSRTAPPAARCILHAPPRPPRPAGGPRFSPITTTCSRLTPLNASAQSTTCVSLTWLDSSLLVPDHPFAYEHAFGTTSPRRPPSSRSSPTARSTNIIAALTAEPPPAAPKLADTRIGSPPPTP